MVCNDAHSFEEAAQKQRKQTVIPRVSFYMVAERFLVADTRGLTNGYAIEDGDNVNNVTVHEGPVVRRERQVLRGLRV